MVASASFAWKIGIGPLGVAGGELVSRGLRRNLSINLERRRFGDMCPIVDNYIRNYVFALITRTLLPANEDTITRLFSDAEANWIAREGEDTGDVMMMMMATKKIGTPEGEATMREMDGGPGQEGQEETDHVMGCASH